MHPKLKFLLVLFLLFAISFSFQEKVKVNGQDCGADLDCQINQIQKEIDALTPAQNNNKKELADLNNQLASLKTQIGSVSNQLDDLSVKISKREDDLTYTRKIFEEKVGDQYKFLRIYDPIMPFLSSNASDAFQEIVLRQKVASNSSQIRN